MSETSDPTGAWNAYQFDYPNQNVLNDYPKFGVWPATNNSAYFASFNQFRCSSSVCDFAWRGAGRRRLRARRDDRRRLPAGQVYFNLYRVDPNLGGQLPERRRRRRARPSANQPNVFMQFDADEWGYVDDDQLELWEFDGGLRHAGQLDVHARRRSRRPRTSTRGSAASGRSSPASPRSRARQQARRAQRPSDVPAAVPEAGGERRAAGRHPHRAGRPRGRPGCGGTSSPTTAPAGRSRTRAPTRPTRRRAGGWAASRWTPRATSPRGTRCRAAASSRRSRSPAAPRARRRTRSTWRSARCSPASGPRHARRRYNRWGDYSDMTVAEDGCTFYYTTAVLQEDRSVEVGDAHRPVPDRPGGLHPVARRTARVALEGPGRGPGPSRVCRYPVRLMRLSDAVRADAARRSRRCRDRVAPPAAAGGVRPPRDGRRVLLRCRSALRVMRKIEAIVREEMDAAGSIEVRVPIVLPAEPWKATGRWEVYGDEVFKLEDRHGREMMLGPTEEEVFAPLVAGDLPSYRDLPVNLFQVEWKYRDEKRPRFGLLRGREFLMKDAYSFDRDEEGMRGELPRDVRGVRAHLRPHRARSRDRGGRPRHDRRRHQPRVHGARRRRRGSVRAMRERRLPRRHRGRDAAGAAAPRRAPSSSRWSRSTPRARRRSSWSRRSSASTPRAR